MHVNRISRGTSALKTSRWHRSKRPPRPLNPELSAAPASNEITLAMTPVTPLVRSSPAVLGLAVVGCVENLRQLIAHPQARHGITELPMRRGALLGHPAGAASVTPDERDPAGHQCARGFQPGSSKYIP